MKRKHRISNDDAWPLRDENGQPFAARKVERRKLPPMEPLPEPSRLENWLIVLFPAAIICMAWFWNWIVG
jgi:hypothetical protein